MHGNFSRGAEGNVELEDQHAAPVRLRQRSSQFRVFQLVFRFQWLLIMC